MRKYLIYQQGRALGHATGSIARADKIAGRSLSHIHVLRDTGASMHNAILNRRRRARRVKGRMPGVIPGVVMCMDTQMPRVQDAQERPTECNQLLLVAVLAPYPQKSVLKPAYFS